MRRFLPPKSWILAAASGLLLALACPPVGMFPLAWIGLIPLFFALEYPRRGGIGEGAVAGAVFNTGVVYWLAFNNGTYPIIATASMITAVAVLACGWGTASWLFILVRRRFGIAAWLLAPFSWIAWEGWLAHLGELAFPWPILALTQADFSPLLQIMEFTGFYGVSFWVVAVNTALFLSLIKTDVKVKRVNLVFLSVLVATPIFAYWNAKKYNTENLESLRVMVVQGNIPARLKWLKGAEFSWTVYDSLTREGKSDSVDLIVWPETAIPVHLRHQSGYANLLSGLSNEMGASILTGASDYARLRDEHRPLNSAFFVRPGEGIIGRSAKQFLVPFGERVPFQKLIPQLGKLNFGQAEFLPGLRASLFETSTSKGSLTFLVTICFESIFPRFTREAVQRGADLLVTVSNDAWYGRSSEYEQIAALSRFRCIETRRSMARASNTGISLLVDHLGKEVVRTKLFVPAQITADLPLCNTNTFYVIYGDLFLIIATVIYGILLIKVAAVRNFSITDN